MSTSPHEGVYLYNPAEFGADRFVDTGLARDGVLNSALHKADSAAQPRCIWVAPPAALWVDDSDPFLVPEATQVGIFFRFPLVGHYAPKVRASGAGYRVRITLGGRSSAGHSCDFKVMVTPPGVRLFGDTTGTPWPTKFFSNVTSTTIAMLTPDDALRWLDIPQRVIDEAVARESWSTLTDIGGDSIGVIAPRLEVTVFASTANVSSTPELHLSTFQEVIGT